VSGLVELGLDPRSVVEVRTATVESALRVTADALACDALGAVMLEIWGETRQLDLVASRKLSLAARMSGVTGFILRMSATPSPSTAETRWIVRAARSPPRVVDWGAPLFDAQLIRNRHGPTGQWIMEWKCDECLFLEPASHSQPLVAASADRSYPSRPFAKQRRAG